MILIVKMWNLHEYNISSSWFIFTRVFHVNRKVSSRFWILAAPCHLLLDKNNILPKIEKNIILCIWKKHRISDKDIVTIWYRNILAKVTQYKGYIRFLRDILASILVILAKICKYRKSATLHFLTLKNHSIILPYNGYIWTWAKVQDLILLYT